MLLVASFVLGSAPAHGAAFEDLDRLQARITQFLAANGSATLDRRMRLASCTQAASIAWQGERGNALTVGCADQPGWRIFVPVRRGGIALVPVAARTANVQTAPVAKPMLVAARPLAKGVVITAADVCMGDSAAVANFPDVLTRAEDAIGQTTTRPVMAGTPLRLSTLAAPKIVKRGDPVRINAGGPGFRISADGIAEEDGAIGARIRVRNAGTGEMSRVIVESAGNVAIPGYNIAAIGRE